MKEIEKEIKNKEIELAELNLKRLYGERGYRLLSHVDLTTFLMASDIVYPKRAYLAGVEKDYVCVQEDGKLCIGGYERNDRHSEPYRLEVDSDGNLPWREGVNGKMFKS